jgi:hypothetical protein
LGHGLSGTMPAYQVQHLEFKSQYCQETNKTLKQCSTHTHTIFVSLKKNTMKDGYLTINL